MSPLRMLYLGLAVWGAVHPVTYMATWMMTQGAGPLALLAAWRADPAAAALFWDLLIASLALSLWVVAETWVRRNWLALVALPATFLVGLSFGLPLYLFLRTRPV